MPLSEIKYIITMISELAFDGKSMNEKTFCILIYFWSFLENIFLSRSYRIAKDSTFA